MNKYLLIIFLMTFGASIFAHPEGVIELPPRGILKDRLVGHGLGFFMERTEIDATLADSKLYPIGIMIKVLEAMNDFSLNMDNERDIEVADRNMITVTEYLRLEKLLRCILQDHPEAFEELKKQGIYSRS